MSHEFVILRTSLQPLESICQRLPEVAQRHRFGVLGTHDLRQKMESKGVPFPRECRVFEVCNPQQAQAVLTQAMEVSTALPCRISVYEENGRTVLATLKPTRLLTLFGALGAAEVAQAVEETLVRIMDETVAD